MLRTVKELLEDKLQNWQDSTMDLPPERLQTIEHLWKYGLSAQEAKDFTLLTRHLQDGLITSEVPLLDNVTASHTLEKMDLEHNFNQSNLVWKTPLGVIKSFECKHPVTNKVLSGQLFMSADYVEKHFDLMYNVLQEAQTSLGFSTNSISRENFLAQIILKTLSFNEAGIYEQLSDSYLKLPEKLFPNPEEVTELVRNFKMR